MTQKLIHTLAEALPWLPGLALAALAAMMTHIVWLSGVRWFRNRGVRYGAEQLKAYLRPHLERSAPDARTAAERLRRVDEPLTRIAADILELWCRKGAVPGLEHWLQASILRESEKRRAGTTPLSFYVGSAAFVALGGMIGDMSGGFRAAAGAMNGALDPGAILRVVSEAFVVTCAGVAVAVSARLSLGVATAAVARFERDAQGVGGFILGLLASAPAFGAGSNGAPARPPAAAGEAKRGGGTP